MLFTACVSADAPDMVRNSEWITSLGEILDTTSMDAHSFNHSFPK